MLHQSLKDLDTEYIDHYMIHWPDKRVDIRYPMEILAKAQVQGKIKSIGLCNTTLLDFEMASEVATIKSVQHEYNLFNRGAVPEILEKENLFQMGWGTFDKGILAGSVDGQRIFPKTDARSWAPWWKKSNWKKKASFVEKYKDVIFDYALLYSMKNTDLSLCGAKSIEQFEKINISIKKEKSMKMLQEIEIDFESFS